MKLTAKRWLTASLIVATLGSCEPDSTSPSSKISASPPVRQQLQGIKLSEQSKQNTLWTLEATQGSEPLAGHYQLHQVRLKLSPIGARSWELQSSLAQWDGQVGRLKGPVIAQSNPWQLSLGETQWHALQQQFTSPQAELKSSSIRIQGQQAEVNLTRRVLSLQQVKAQFQF